MAWETGTVPLDLSDRALQQREANSSLQWRWLVHRPFHTPYPSQLTEYQGSSSRELATTRKIRGGLIHLPQRADDPHYHRTPLTLTSSAYINSNTL